MTTCRDEILTVARALAQQHADGTFSTQDILTVMRERGTQHRDTTIRRHVATEMCINAAGPHAAKYHDFERVDRGRFKLR